MWTDQDREKYKADGRRYPSDLTDAEWDIIEPLFRGYFTYTADMREVVNGCFYLEHTGCPWRALPTDFGPHQTVRTWYDRFRAEGVWADAAAQLTRRVREAHGHEAKPTTGIMDSQSVVSGPQQGERGFDGNKKIKGVKRHVLTCSLGFVLAILVTAANIHDTKAAELLLDRAVESGFDLDRVKVDGIYVGPAVRSAAYQHNVDFQVSTRESKSDGFAPLPLRWRIDFGTMTNRYRRLTRNLEQYAKSAEDAFELANFRRVLRVYARDVHSIA
jgi:putative transposase